MSLPEGTPVVPAKAPLTRIVGVGCFMAWIGGLSGAMVAVLIGKGVAYLQRAPSCAGIPTCDWYIYAAVGGAVGALTLPWFVVSALRRSPAPLPPPSDPPDETN